MALFVRQNEQRSQLQEKLAADLKNKLNNGKGIAAEETEPTILENAHKTRPAGIIIGILLLLTIAVLVVTMFLKG